MNWNASNYNERKAQRAALRLAQVKPRWVTNPDTGEEFYLRKVDGLMSSVLAGYMPTGLTKTAVEAWQEQGVAGTEPVDLMEMAQKLTPEQREAGQEETKTLATIVQAACVIPLLSNDAPSEVVFTDEWKEMAIAGLKEKDKDFDPATFDPKSLVFNPLHLDDPDAVFLFRWARGFDLGIKLKGGNVTDIQDVERFRKKLNRGSRTRATKSEVRDTA